MYSIHDYGMEISSEKSKTMVNNRDESVHANIRINGEILEEVDKCKYLGVTITKDGTSEADIRLSTSTSDLIRLKTIWTSTQICFKTKCRLYKTLVLSLLLYVYMILYATY